MPDLEPREELASIAASLRAYLEWQVDCGSSGIPRRARSPVPAPPPLSVRGGAPEPELEPESPVSASPPPSSTAAPLPPFTFASSSEPPPPTSSALRSPSTPPPPTVVGPTKSLPVLLEEVRSCTRCALAATRTNTVFSRGNPEAALCFVGEAPGADEDAQGLPFVGRAGQLLDKMITAMGLDPQTEVYVCNIIKCRPPGNRRPEPAEIETCIGYLHEQLANVNPKVIVALGNTAVAALLGTKLGITKVRGAWKLYRGRTPVMPTYHPSYLLRPGPTQADAKRQAWEDLQTVMKELGLTRPRRN
jgi:DNA polymerase